MSAPRPLDHAAQLAAWRCLWLRLLQPVETPRQRDEHAFRTCKECGNEFHINRLTGADSRDTLYCDPCSVRLDRQRPELTLFDLLAEAAGEVP